MIFTPIDISRDAPAHHLQHPRFRDDAKQWAGLMLALFGLIAAVHVLKWLGV